MNNRFKTAGVASVLALAPVAAFASPDTSEITASIASYGAAGVVLVLAMAAAIWGLRAAGLFKRG